MKKVFFILAVVLFSGCYYIRQDWDMYPHTDPVHDVGDAGKE